MCNARHGARVRIATIKSRYRGFFVGGVRRGYWWAWWTAVAVPVLGLAVALPAHYPNNFDTLGHLGLIYADTVLFVVGALLALTGLRAVAPSD